MTMSERLKRYFKGDPIIWVVIFALSVFSILAVLSSTGTLAYRYHGGNVFYYILKHVMFLFFGFLSIYFIHLVPFKYFSRISQLLLIISIPLLLVTLVFGASINESRRWLLIPGTGLTFQTSDLAKIALIMFLARMLSLKQDQIKSFRNAFIPMVIPVFTVCALILPANLSTALLLGIVSFILMFVGRVRFTHILLTGTVISAILVLLIVIAVNSDWEGRWETWRNRWISFTEADSGDQYQADQSKIAIATGGVIGKGPGNSVQRNFLPHPYSDFIFAIIVEEWGLLGGLFIIFLYLYLLFRAGVIVRRSTYTFQAFLAFGLTILLVLQAMVNMAVAVGVLPVTGQPLPLISMGGTSIVFTCTALGMILSVSRSTYKTEEPELIVVENEQET